MSGRTVLWSRANRQRLYRGLALLLYKLPRGVDTVLRIVRQRSGSPEDYRLALEALAQAGVELGDEKKSLKRSLKPPRRKRRR